MRCTRLSQRDLPHGRSDANCAVSAMPRLPQTSILEHDFLLKALSEQSIRTDGRGLLEARELSVTCGTSYGSVEVTLGGGGHTPATRVSAQVSADIVKPRDERPFEGFLVVHSEISPIAGSNHEAGGR